MARRYNPITGQMEDDENGSGSGSDVYSPGGWNWGPLSPQSTHISQPAHDSQNADGYRFPVPVKQPYKAGWDPSNSLRGSLSGQFGQADQDLGAYRSQAMRTGPSAWAGLANNQQDFEAGNARSNLAGSIQGQEANQMGSLAMRGGLDSGARERIGREGSQNYLNMNQDINKGLAGNKMQIGMNDEQNRISQMSALPGMDLNNIRLQGEASQFDTQQQAAESARYNDWNQANYGLDMMGYAGQQQADNTQFQDSRSSWDKLTGHNTRRI